MKNLINDVILENSPILQRLANNFTTDPDEKNDLVQETFIRSLKSLERFINHPKIVSWLYVIMKNVYLNKYRRMNLHRLAENELIHSGENNTSKNIANSKFVLNDIEKAIKSLSEENYTIISMYLEGFKYHEIAKQMEIKEGTIKTRIHSIRKSLRKKLEVYATS
ncbi:MULTISPECIES: RNA polymerase sigma factor [Sphingobacterium]|uniref:RNA polymerase sigma factor n=1 Tax=Sphingobacterium cellulitidis TaxID=1768011 RepID=A0A8H9G137_9SPHI|nr:MULTISPECIES: RNA polymerase sigma factor [Sphingobacterium]MBA8986882.1 RNA polymerase sigma-70 factor (ECF subfamily) [Sphingobacterium soli]WFB64908.1 RNA polymerase sigma factor [Sphingobacterium sp. WM]GGE14703.1 RNA polymerase sigma factor [Sphingobacterium soli]